jgi:hypothetical protein
MGGMADGKGMTLEFHDPEGNPDETRPSITGLSCWVTGQAPQKPGLGSADWLKEAYLAPDPASLYALMRTYPPTGTTNPFTSAASQSVTVHYFDKDGAMQSEKWNSVIGEGTDTPVKLGDGTSENLRLFQTLKLTQGFPLTDPSNALHKAAVGAIKFLAP